MGEFSALLRTCEHRGDHGADIGIAIQCKESMTIGEFFEKANSKSSQDRLKSGKDHIEIRIIQG